MTEGKVYETLDINLEEIKALVEKVRTIFFGKRFYEYPMKGYTEYYGSIVKDLFQE